MSGERCFPGAEAFLVRQADKAGESGGSNEKAERPVVQVDTRPPQVIHKEWQEEKARQPKPKVRSWTGRGG